MRETERMANLLEHTFEGRAYYGNSVLDALAGVGAETAARRVRCISNSIRQIVRHMTLELVYHRQLLEGVATQWTAGETT